uniref:Uncharacterized protein n=1 Tax=Leersia perrieri TaxID=77586 RepID=A0A0D9WPA1_9ORYZ
MAGNKRKEPNMASESDVPTQPTEKKKKKILSNRRKYAIPCEASEVLKKKEAMAAFPLWSPMDDEPDDIDNWIEEQTKKAAAGTGKKKKVVKCRLPNGLVKQMIRQPFRTIEVMSEEELATCSESYRQVYTLRKFIDDKWFDDEQTLIDPYNKQGYAEDESEITDDEEEEN